MRGKRTTHKGQYVQAKRVYERMKKAQQKTSIRAKRFAGSITKSDFLLKIAVLIDRIDSLARGQRFSRAYKEWEGEVNSLLCFSFGDDAAQVSDFKEISYCPSFFFSGQPDSVFDEAFLSGLQNAKAVLATIKKEVESYFPPDRSELAEKDVSLLGTTTKDVFIVHGHDETLRLEVENVLRKLGLNPVVLKDQANEGMTLIQKFEKESSNACFVVVLLTADEDAKVRKSSVGEVHARQNVVFEMGYFFNAFKRKDGSHKGLFAILEDGVTKPGDIDGLVYQPYRKGDEGWKLQLAREIKAAGIPVDLNKLS